MLNLLRHKHVPRSTRMPTPTLGVQVEERRKREKKSHTISPHVLHQCAFLKEFSRAICLVLHQKYGAFEEGRCFAPQFGHQVSCLFARNAFALAPCNAPSKLNRSRSALQPRPRRCQKIPVLAARQLRDETQANDSSGTDVLMKIQ